MHVTAGVLSENGPEAIIDPLQTLAFTDVETHDRCEPILTNIQRIRTDLIFCEPRLRSCTICELASDPCREDCPRHIPIVLVHEQDAHDAVRKALQAGVDLAVGRPLHPQKIRTTMRFVRSLRKSKSR